MNLKFVDLYRIFKNFIKRFYSMPSLVAVRNGLLAVYPIVLIGAIAIMLINFPMSAIRVLFEEFNDGIFLHSLEYWRLGLNSFISLLMAAGISFCYAEERGASASLKIISPINAMCCFLILTCMRGDALATETSFGTSTVFVSILSSILSTKILYTINGRISNYRKFNAHANGTDIRFVESIMSVFAVLICVVLSTCLRVYIDRLTQYNGGQQLLASLFASLFEMVDAPFLRGITYIFLVQFLWFFGIHGGMVLEGAMPESFLNGLATEGSLSAETVFTKSFVDVFIHMGGSGLTLALILCVLIHSKNKGFRGLSKLGIITSIFNINETITFGVPVIFNPILFIPFVFAPIIIALLDYALIMVGIIPPIVNSLHWTTPVLISGYKATGSIMGSVLQLLNIILGVLLYMPFVKVFDSQLKKTMVYKLKKLYKQLDECEKSLTATNFLSPANEYAPLVRKLVSDIETAIDNKRMYMVFQPQMNSDGSLYGTEALLRWEHEELGSIRPDFIIALSREAGLLNRLEKYIISMVTETIRDVGENADKYKISMNVTADFLSSDDFEERITEIVRQNNISPSRVWFEITEQMAIKNGIGITDKLKRLKEHGYHFIIDDFGMGYTSLIYLQTNCFDMVKIDGSLVRNIVENKSCAEIISSIIHLSRSMHFVTAAEYVETREQVDILSRLGCDYYQGYYFARPVTAQKLSELFANSFCTNTNN